MFKMVLRTCLAALVGAAAWLGSPAVAAAQAATVVVTAADDQGLALPGVSVSLRTASQEFVASGITDTAGRAHLRDVPPGSYRLSASLLGFATYVETMTVGAGGVTTGITMAIGSFAQELIVTALMPEVPSYLIIPATEIESRVGQDLAQSLREHPGVTSLRRGPINLDPSVRGLYAEQIGVFVDGTRTFAAGPARMDSGLSHVSAHALESLRVVRGPYALTWGAGTLSAIQAETFKPAFSSGDRRLGGRAGYNYGGNGDASDAFANLYGSSDTLRFSFQHNRRTGNDYTDGADNEVQGDYASFDTRWDVGARLNRRTILEYSGGYQKQNDIDYPGRILDATFFQTQSHAVAVSHVPGGGAITEIAGQFYANLKDHRMNNDQKPTARPRVGRTPPFGIGVDLPTTADTTGGRAHVALAHGDARYKVGFDSYRLEQSATRTITNRATGAVPFRDVVWPDARVTNVGGYGQAIYDRGRATVGGTVRLDHEQARVGEVSRFFRDHATGDLPQDNTNVSAAGNVSLRVTNNLVVNLGAGRAVRNPSVLERYSDRFPAIKFQTPAEFLGNPGLVPEKSLEVNAGAVVQFGQATLEGDYFFRTIDDYITVRPDAGLPTRLPLSPPIVFRYVQGDDARFTGYDIRAGSGVGAWIDLHGAWSYVRAEDTAFAEPLFGVPPFEQRYGLTVHTPDLASQVALSVTRTAAQDRVATARFEVPTAGWTTVDLQASFDLVAGLTIRAGVRNLTNEFYVNHLNSFNPFTGERIAEVGRSAYIGTEFAF